MIKINKDLNNIPTSLKPPTEDYFPHPSRPIQQSYTTHQRREEVIDVGVYISKNKYNERYKYRDVKEALFELYHKKCAFCEQRVEAPHVEHFRPKNKYYWLAYSWDNLLIACSTCNSIKGDRFAFEGEEYNFVFDSENAYKTIHSSCAELDEIEKPLLVNPEVEDLTAELIFNEKGGVRSDHPRVAHTIKECGLSRHDLMYQRKKLLDTFEKRIEFILNLDKSWHDKSVMIEGACDDFINFINDPESSYIQFRKFFVNKAWLSRIVDQTIKEYFVITSPNT